MTTQNYTAAFLFWRNEVLLVQKNSPEWQKGYLNAVGGKVEEGESYEAANLREFHEETGLESETFAWRHFATESGTAAEPSNTYQTHFFAAEAHPDEPRPEVPQANDVGERLIWAPSTLPPIPNAIGNLRWLIPLAVDWRSKELVTVVVHDSIADKPAW